MEIGSPDEGDLHGGDWRGRRGRIRGPDAGRGAFAGAEEQRERQEGSGGEAHTALGHAIHAGVKRRFEDGADG